MDARKVLGNNVKKHRLAANLTQAELAIRVGVDRAYISGLELGQRNPTVISVWHVANALDAPMARMFDETSGNASAPKRRVRKKTTSKRK